jgi:hypothetical protein
MESNEPKGDGSGVGEMEVVEAERGSIGLPDIGISFHLLLLHHFILLTSSLNIDLA